MTSAVRRAVATKCIDKFATEWAMVDENEIVEHYSEEDRPERRAPGSSTDAMGRPARGTSDAPTLPESTGSAKPLQFIKPRRHPVNPVRSNGSPASRIPAAS